MAKAKRKQPVTLAKTGKKKREPNNGSFKPGFDPRRNLNGAPRSHDELRQLIQAIGAEDVQGYTRVELKLRAMFASQKPPDNVAVLEHGWGKVPQQDNSFNVNIDLSQLTDEQLGMLANGADIRAVLATTGEGGTGTPPETTA